MDFLYQWKKWQWSLVVAALGALLLLCGWFFDARQGADVARQITTIENTVTVARSRFDQVVQTVATRRRDYPSKYSNSFDSQLQQARERLSEGRVVDALLAKARQAQKERDWKTVYSLLKELDAILSQDVGVVDRILGPPGTSGQGYYDVLDQKSAEVDNDLLGRVGIEISASRAYADQLPRKNRCDSGVGLSFSRAYSKISEAQAQLAVTYETSVILIEGMIDKPQVYDQAMLAKSLAQAAVDEGNADATNVDHAQSSINAAQAAIDNASNYIVNSNYRQTEALIALDGARSTLSQAKQACYAEDFVGAISLADQAQREAYSAEDTATTPTPPPTSVPIAIDLDDDDDFTFGSGGGGFDFDSSDGGGFDSGGWDSGGGFDGGGWDSGGGDDGGGW